MRAHPSAGEPVAIDLRRVRAMSVPFADGFFVPLLSSWLAGYYDEHPILVFGASGFIAVRRKGERIGGAHVLPELSEEERL